MIITNHVWTGAVIGAVAPGPVSAFTAGVASHFLLDQVPHWGEERIFLRVAVLDGLVGLTAMSLLARATRRPRRATVVAGMLGACLPDADKPGDLFWGRSPFPAALDAWHVAIQREHEDRMPQEVVLGTVGFLLARRVVRQPRVPRVGDRVEARHDPGQALIGGAAPTRHGATGRTAGVRWRAARRRR